MGVHAANRRRMHVAEPVQGLSTIALVVAVSAGVFGVSLLAAGRPGDAAFIVVGLVAAAAAVAFPRTVLAFALVATVFPQRVGPAELNMSVTDAFGLLALLAALRFVPWRDRRVRLVLGGLALYLGLLAVSLIPHHATRAVFEWGHRGVLYGGSVLVGIAIVRSGTTTRALRLYMVAASAIAVAAALDALRTGFEPASVFQLQKNHAGLLLAAGFCVAFAARRELGWPQKVTLTLRVLMVVGLAATQSRAAALGLVAALAIRPLLLGRRGNERTLSIGVLVVAVGLLVVSAVSINERELNRPEDELQFNSINTRTDVLEQAIDQVWAYNRFVGGGLRYFTDPTRPFPTPHNLVVGEMAEAGLIGLAGLAVLLVATVLALRRSPGWLATLGTMALVLRVTQGLADVFWVAGPLTVALVLVGMGLADDPVDRRRRPGAVDDRWDRPTLAPSRDPVRTPTL